MIDNYLLNLYNAAFLQSEAAYLDMALDAFFYQKEHCTIYNQYLHAINAYKLKPSTLTQIPFLPITFYKSHIVANNIVDYSEPIIFKSSGTGLVSRAKHLIHNPNIYNNISTQIFTNKFGAIKDYCILGLLPNYVAQGDSSLVHMVNLFINISNHPLSNTYLNNYKELFNAIQQLNNTNTPTLLIGVTYAMLEFAEQYGCKLSNNFILMETGGMKGRGKEWTKQEVHNQLKEHWQLQNIYSEYGMTELLSQAYSNGEDVFTCPPSMRVLCRDYNNPMDVTSYGKGALNIIDLANIYSCSFIATQDVGTVTNNTTFTVQGRMDNSDVRGCNMLL